MKTSEVKARLNQNGVHFDTLSIREGIYTLRLGFFYRFGNNSSKLVEGIKNTFPEVTIVDHGEIWKPFSGGSSVKNSSHWFVKFQI